MVTSKKSSSDVLRAKNRFQKILFGRFLRKLLVDSITAIDELIWIQLTEGADLKKILEIPKDPRRFFIET